jgi:hypothetical protein
MPNMSNFCKVYPFAKVAQWPKWPRRNASETAVADAKGDPKFVFIHDNYVVTRGIFVDEDVLFSDVTSEWETFCRESLGFEIDGKHNKTDAAGSVG